jgi:hypothetical protein
MVRKEKEIPFIVTLSFLAGFIFIRLSVFIAGAAESEFAQAAKMGEMPGVDFHIGRNLILFGYHIHHFYIGFALIAIAGWLALVGTSIFSKRHLAMIYGFGLGLFFDEIGLLLTWGDYYSQLSYLLSLFLVLTFLNIVFFHDFWISVRENVKSTEPHLLIWEGVFKHNAFLRTADIISEYTGRTEKTSLIFTGMLYIIIALLVIYFPQTVRYWISVIFIVQGIDYIIRFVRTSGVQKYENV